MYCNAIYSTLHGKIKSTGSTQIRYKYTKATLVSVSFVTSRALYETSKGYTVPSEFMKQGTVYPFDVSYSALLQ